MFGKVAAEPVAALLDQVIVVCYFSAFDHIVNRGRVSWDRCLLSTEWILQLDILLAVESVIRILKWDFYFFPLTIISFIIPSIVSAGP